MALFARGPDTARRNRGTDSAHSRSLRTRWHRAFALLTAVVVVSGVASVAGIFLMVNTYRSSAVGVENEASSQARLRSAIVASAVTVTSQISVQQQTDLAATVVQIRADFVDYRRTTRSAAAQALLTQSAAKFEAALKTAGFPSTPTDLVTRGTAVTGQIPTVLVLLDQAGAADRASVRVALASATRRDREALAGLAVLEVLAVVLAVGLARRLTSEVLRPVDILRDSANRLANGDFNHRVPIDRISDFDEFGELAMSFNAMADAIAGSQRVLTREANTDSLSGLANRAAFYNRLRTALETFDRRSGEQALLFVDLDDFKDVNDTFGHAVGDELLRVVATRLRETVRPGDVVARLGGDEFALLLDGVPDLSHASALAERVVVALATPVKIGPHALAVGASVGLAMRHEASTLEGWVREADVAMYAAKANGKNRVERYNAKLDDASIARQLLKDEVAVAAARDELVVDYQPVVELDTGQLVGLEALVRWQHPKWGLLPPSEFVALAEESGAIASIDAWVMKNATRQLHCWQTRFERPDLWLSVNVSMRELETPGYADRVEELLRIADLTPSSIVIEVTESVLADPDGGAASALTSLRRSGARVALDDFGTGYSSIGYLRELPVDFLKIDRSFVAGAHPGAPGNALLEAIVGMAQRLGLEIIPEGIEQLSELAQLRAIGCHLGQGFLLSRPVAGADIDAMLDADEPFPHVALGGSLTATGS